MELSGVSFVILIVTAERLIGGHLGRNLRFLNGFLSSHFSAIFNPTIRENLMKSLEVLDNLKGLGSIPE
jgi:hypothetical protein